jgi:hypothetical protein
MQLERGEILADGSFTVRLSGGSLPARALYVLRVLRPVPDDWAGPTIRVGPEIAVVLGGSVTLDGEELSGIYGDDRLSAPRWWWSRANVRAPLEHARQAFFGLEDHVCLVPLGEIARLRSDGLTRPEAAARMGIAEHALVAELGAHGQRWGDRRT